MEHIGLTLVGLGFWVFLTVTAVAGIVFEYKKRDLELEPLRAAIERGQQVDPAIIERLMTREQHQSEPQPVYFRIGGIITVASGIGVGVLSFLLEQVAPKAFFPVFGVAILAVCVGVGLIVCASTIERHLSSKAAAGASGPDGA